MKEEEKLILTQNSKLKDFEVTLSTDSKKCYIKPELTALGNLVRTTLGGSGTDGDMFTSTNVGKA